MNSRSLFFSGQRVTPAGRELRRQRRVLLAMSVALALLLAATITAPFWASLYVCLRWGCL